MCMRANPKQSEQINEKKNQNFEQGKFKIAIEIDPNSYKS